MNLALSVLSVLLQCKDVPITCSCHDAVVVGPRRFLEGG